MYCKYKKGGAGLGWGSVGLAWVWRGSCVGLDWGYRSPAKPAGILRAPHCFDELAVVQLTGPANLSGGGLNALRMPVRLLGHADT